MQPTGLSLGFPLCSLKISLSFPGVAAASVLRKAGPVGLQKLMFYRNFGGRLQIMLPSHLTGYWPEVPTRNFCT